MLRTYDRGWLRGDVLAGVTVAAYLVPQVMAYAGLAGLPAVAGLWAGAMALAVYMLLGSSPQLSMGPESTTALMTAATLGGLAAGDPARYAALAAALAGLVGVVCLLAWALRLAFVADLLSRPVLDGYMAGVAVLMIVGQLGRLTGLEASGDDALAQLRSILGQLERVHTPTFALSVMLLVFLLLVGRRHPRAPIPLMGVLLAAAAVVLLDLEERGIAVVGEVPRTLPGLHLPDLAGDDLNTLLPAALGIAVVAFADNVLTGRAFESRSSTGIDARQELLALGTANLAVGATQGFPVSSSASRTAIADAVGGRSQVHSFVALVTVIVSVVVFNPVLAAFPSAALGALVVYAALKLVDVPEFRRILGFRRTEGALAIGTAVAVLLVGVLPGILVAISLSLLDLLHRVTRPHDGVLGAVPGLAGMHDVNDYPHATTVPGLVVYRYDSPLFFANAHDFLTRALAAVDGAPSPPRWLLLNMEANVTVDITAADTLESLRVALEGRDVVLALARVKQDLHHELERAGLLTRLGEGRVFMTLPTALEAYEAWVESTGPAPGDAEPAH